MRKIVFLTLFLALPVLCSAEIYRWVDERGQIGYADDLGKVPKKYRDSALITEKQEQAVEIIEKSEPEKGGKKGSDGKLEPVSKDDRNKAKASYDGKSGEAWRQELAKQKYEVKALEEQLAGLKERLADSSKKSRGEYLTLQNSEKDLQVRIEKARKKLDSLNAAADSAGVPAEYR